MAMHLALAMSGTEQQARLRSLRGIVQGCNVYRWVDGMLIDEARMRQQARLVRQLGEQSTQPVLNGQT
ncbi:MAG: hypothetical protein HP496_15690 [Nitrospira sp.]|nr:hypothetical protein [Nitrospira sp.]